MIILVDNKNFAIRTCKDDNSKLYIETLRPNWKGEMKFFSDIGYVVIMSGKEVEDYLDEENIYYVHVEKVAKENFQNFTKRMKKLVDEHVDLLLANNSSEKLIFGINEGGEVTQNINEDLVFSITRDLKTGEYFTRFDTDDLEDKGDVLDLLTDALERAEAELGPSYYGVEEGDFYDNVNFSSGKSIREVLSKLKMFIAVLIASDGEYRF